MARTGRPPKPVELKRVQGNAGRRKLPVAVKVLESSASIAPMVPGDLEDAGMAVWKQIWDVGAVWLSPQIDVPLIYQACRLFDELQELREQVAHHGMLLEEPIVTPSGIILDATRLVPNPAVKMMRDAEKAFQATLSDLGLSPAARARLGHLQVKTMSKLEELQRSRTAAIAR